MPASRSYADFSVMPTMCRQRRAARAGAGNVRHNHRLSGNSSMPPSADDLPGRTGPGPGKQPGAPGAHLAWRADPDETVPCSRRACAPAAGSWPALMISG
jgi:hypothetical protein